jgi:predicted Zn-dependent protease
VTQESLQQIAADVIAGVKRAAPDAEVFVAASRQRSANVRYANNEIISCGDAGDTDLHLRVKLGRRNAVTLGNQTTPVAVRALVERGVAMARLAPEDPEAMPPLGPQTYATTPAAFDLATEAFGAAERAEVARAAIAPADAAGLQGAGFWTNRGSTHVIATSVGLSALHALSSATFSTTARTKEGDGSGWGGREAVRASELSPGEIAKTACEKGRASAKPKALDPGYYTVILEPAAVAELLSFLVGALDARSADEGRSFFAKAGGGTRIGEKLFADMVTLRSDPTSPTTPGAPFDDEGLALKPTTWIEQGTLSALRYSRFWAQKQGKSPTGGHRVLELSGGAAAKQEDLLVGVKRGVLITRFWYTRWVDPQTMLITGLTRDGTFLVENGAVVGPVNNFRFNESPVTMLKNVDAMTKETFRVPTDGEGHERVPALRTHGFHLASKSNAV